MEHWDPSRSGNSYAVTTVTGVLRARSACEHLDQGSRPARLSESRRCILWKKLGKQITGDVVKQRTFRIDAKSPIGRVSIR